MPLSPYASLRIPDFRRLLVANGTLTVAREAQIVVVGWQVFELTHDPLTLGLIGLAEALPYIGVALYAGHVADRAERRTLGIAGTIGVILSAIALLILTLEGNLIIAKVSATDYEPLAKWKVSEKGTWGHLAVAGNRLLVKGPEELLCYELR